MAWPDNPYSRLVAWMKILLPMAALILLSTLFLISNTVDPSKSIPVAQIDLEKRAHEQGATNPTFTGVTNDGDEVSFRAVHARQDTDDPDHLMARSVEARFHLSSGTIIDISAETADMHQTRFTARLDGNVNVTTTTGYHMTTETLNARIDRLEAETAGHVSGTAPAGQLEAGRMILKSGEESGTAQLIFTDGVKLLYTPGKTKE